MKHLTVALVVLGFIAWVFPVLAWLTPTAGRAFSTQHSPSTPFTIAASIAYGAVCFWFAWAVRARLRAAWRLGWVGLFATWLLMIGEVARAIAVDPQEATFGAKVGVVALIVACFSAVFLFWGRRWYVHKSYFTQPPTG